MAHCQETGSVSQLFSMRLRARELDLEPVCELPYGPAALNGRIKGRTEVSTRLRACTLNFLLALKGASTEENPKPKLENKIGPRQPIRKVEVEKFRGVGCCRAGTAAHPPAAGTLQNQSDVRTRPVAPMPVQSLAVSKQGPALAADNLAAEPRLPPIWRRRVYRCSRQISSSTDLGGERLSCIGNVAGG
jgi:hypothetical protein